MNIANVLNQVLLLSFPFTIVLFPCCTNSLGVKDVTGPVSSKVNTTKGLLKSVPGPASSLVQCLTNGKLTPQDSTFYPTDVWFTTRGYTTESHTVTTEDNYILKIFRVTDSPNALPRDQGKTKPAVFLNHGVAGSSNQWLVQEGRNNIITALADNGYDVWIGNCRGNVYSNKHATLTENDLKFWDFSFHEMGVMDVPAIIDEILKVTGLDQISYIGYSMGTTQAVIMLSERPEYNQKLNLMILLAPAEIVAHATSPIIAISVLQLNINGKYLSDPIFGGRIDPNQLPSKFANANLGTACAASSITNCAVCKSAVFFFFGFNPTEANYTAIPSLFTNYFGVTGTKTLVHFTQQVNDRLARFRKFDYGPRDNLQRYGNKDPPEYNLTNIVAPTFIFYGRGDNLVVKRDVESLVTKFRPGVIKQLNLIDAGNLKSKFNHIDFVLGVHIGDFIIDPVLSILRNETNGNAV